MIYFNNRKTFRDRLYYLILKDMEKSDITGLLTNGFRGLDNFSEEELIDSVIDRYNLWDNENDIYKLTKQLLKMTIEEIEEKGYY